MIDVRSTVLGSNLQEILDASVSTKHALQKGQNQYQTPEWLAKACHALLPEPPTSVLDPQCAGGNLFTQLGSHSLGVEIDNRSSEDSRINVITGNCVDVFATLDELYPSARFPCIVSNPPFGLRWKQPDGTTIDSTQWTWDVTTKRLVKCGYGFMISNANTLERLGISQHPWVYLYQRFPAGGVWENCNVEIGIVHYVHPSEYQPKGYHSKVWEHVPGEMEMSQLRQYVPRYYRRVWDLTPLREWATVKKIIDEERKPKSEYNIWQDSSEKLKTYLSTRQTLKLGREDIDKLSRVNNCHPLTLTTDRETRKILHYVVSSGIYTIESKASKAITDALAEVATYACPISKPTDFELVAYADEEDFLVCRATDENKQLILTPGKKYEIQTNTYRFNEHFTRKVLHFDVETEETELEDHDIKLSGIDRYIEILDDNGRLHRFMDRPDPAQSRWQHPEKMLWELFVKPNVQTVADIHKDRYEANLEKMSINEMIAEFAYFPGQLDYCARVGVKDYALVGADVGTGKTLVALTLVCIKSPKRTLIIAPQGTMRSHGEEDDTDYQASQWITEIRRFAPTEPVFQLFSKEDYFNVLHANGGELPPGIYISYPQAYFSNDAFEVLPRTWNELDKEEKFCKRYGLPYDPEHPPAKVDSYSVGIGFERNGVRCVAEPSLATIISMRNGEWDMVIMDEAHLCCNLNANITQNFIRLQPKYRFAMTATPIPNIISNIFSLMGWLCVDGWYKGDRRNAAWPYSVDEIGRFNTTFLSMETDLTVQEKARAAGKRALGGVRTSPIISSPARLLKLLKPTMAYISKEDCNPNLMPCHVMDVRVPIGKEQAELYGYWLDRANYTNEFKSALTIALVQLSRLRGICASPATVDYNRGKCKSNFNPKLVTILQLIRDCLAKREQVVVVSSRVEQSNEIATRLSMAGIPLARIDSTVDASLHVAEANRFKRGDARVMLMGIKCAQGHSFDQCPNLIIGSLEWSYGTLHQAKGRVWRLTSPKPVKVWCVLHQNTIEELLFDRVATKQDAATLCLHGKRVPRDYQSQDASEILAEHVVSYSAKDGQVMSESECEAQWPHLMQQLILSNRS